ncbi:hypothetical protein TYRP_017420 [Tyrophagus putrescentiae]|nr:hypothetical protein TYRP_017420 [Tyrophagus putrescentiae]
MANPNVTFGTTSAMLHSSRSTSMLGGFGLMTPSGGSSSFLGSGKSAKKGAGSRLSSGSFLGLGGSIDGSLIGTGSSGIGTMGHEEQGGKVHNEQKYQQKVLEEVLCSATSAAGVATTSSSGPLFATPLAAKRIKFEFDSD